MNRGALAMVLLFAAAARSLGAPRPDLHLRSRLLMREIRAQAEAPKKDTAALRARLSVLKAENGAAPDEKVSAQLLAAEANLALVEGGSPLAPPSPEESVSDEELRDAVAQPAAAPRASIPREAASAGFHEASPAMLPETAASVFDGSRRRGGPAAPAVGIPPEEPEADLARYLEFSDKEAQRRFLVPASAGLLQKLHEEDKTGARAEYLAMRLHSAISDHPKRSSFVTLRVAARKDKKLHLIYRARDGGAVDEELGDLDAWSYPPKGGVGGGKKKTRNKSSAGGGADAGGDDGDGGGSKHGKGRGGRKGHRGGGGASGGGGGGGGASGAGRGGSGAAPHAKRPHAAGGGGMFDGGGNDGDEAGGGTPGGGMFSGQGPRGHSRRKGSRGGGAGAAAGEASSEASGGDASGAFGSGRAHASAGRTISGEGPGASRSRRRGALVPLPKDFTSRGGGSRLRAEGGEGGAGPKGAGLNGFRSSPLGKKDFHRDFAPPPRPTPTAGAPRPPMMAPANALAQAKASADSASGPTLRPPFKAEDDLRDAVAGNARNEPAPAADAARPAPVAPAGPQPAGSGPRAAACACAAAIGLGAYALRRMRRA